MVVDGPRGFLTTSGILIFNVKLKPLCMGSQIMMNYNFQETRVGVSLVAKLWGAQVERRGKFFDGLLDKAIGDQGVERGNNKPMVNASYDCTTIDMEMRRLLRCRGLLTKRYKGEFNIPKGTHSGLNMVEVS
ncbi:hypothetical protein J1N35_011829 [Gossypium stocksii]|uniref:Uncharacterized protein n=1 Tax=Gossypium stocksii TaxID=47602 RepID=A0A9D4ADY7_9ROSI|nr:hypothetical protein J1N35_011829 [Gossypium stocksii]